MKHRILGVLVVIGLVVILLPFFQSSRELPSEKLLVKAPPFPEQNTQIAQDTIANDEIETTIPSPNSNTTAALSPQEQKPEEQKIVQQPDDTIPANSPAGRVADGSVPPSVQNPVTPQALQTSNNTSVKTETVSAAQVPANTVLAANTTDKTKLPETMSVVANNEKMNDKTAAPVSTKSNHPDGSSNAGTNAALSPDDSDDEEDTAVANEKPVQASKKTGIVKAQTTASVSKNSTKIAAVKTKFVPKIIEYQTIASTFNRPLDTSITNNGLMSLKNAAWVIQIGSFKNKSYALRLVNQLRANGYRAFIQQMNTSVGDTTRVFVGPEAKQDHARATADRLAANMRLHGIVISYKPLTL